jgi:hypothetical protein
MADGDLVSDYWQMEYRETLLGEGSSFALVQAEGLLDLPALQTADRLRLRRHGLSPGDDFAASRSIVLQIEVDADDTTALNSTMSTLLDITRPGLDESPLTLKVPGVAGGGKRRVNVRPRRREVPIDLDFFYGLPMVTIEFVATDPRIYDATPWRVVTALPSGTGGLSFPATSPLYFDAQSETGDIEAENQGTFPVAPVIRIDGPVTNPTVTHLEKGSTLDFTITLGASDYLIIDNESRSVLLNGTSNRYSTLTSTSQWWDLDPGDNTIRFRSDTNTEAAVMTAYYRSAWL